MENYPQARRRTSGAKAIAIDARKLAARYRLYQLIALLSAAALTLGLHVIFGH